MLPCHRGTHAARANHLVTKNMQLYHTFISYSRADAEFALKLANDLREAGVNVWLDQLDIPPGARWDRAVETALETCGRLLVILSSTSATSENVQDEIGVAFDNNKPIVPILSEVCEVPMRLRRLQYIDFTKDYGRGLQTLLAVLKLPIAAPESVPANEAAGAAGAPARARPLVDTRVGYSPTPSIEKQSAPSSRNRLMVIAGAVAAALVLMLWLASGNSGTSVPVDGITPDGAAPEAADAAPAGTQSAFGTMANVKIINDSDREIRQMYMRRSGQSDWGPDRLGEEVIGSKGGQHTLTQIPCESYDVKLVDQDSDECVIPAQNVCEHDQTWQISSDDLADCQQKH